MGFHLHPNNLRPVIGHLPPLLISITTFSFSFASSSFRFQYFHLHSHPQNKYCRLLHLSVWFEVSSIQLYVISPNNYKYKYSQKRILFQL